MSSRRRTLVDTVFLGFERLPLSALNAPAETPPPEPEPEPLPTDEDGFDDPADAGWSAPSVDPDDTEYDRVWTGRVDGADRGLLKANGAHPVRPAPEGHDGRRGSHGAWRYHVRMLERARERSEA